VVAIQVTAKFAHLNTCANLILPPILVIASFVIMITINRFVQNATEVAIRAMGLNPQTV